MTEAKNSKLALHWQILIAIGLGFLLGLASIYKLDSEWFGTSFVPQYKFVGTIFLNLLKMIIVPLIAASIISSIARMGGTSGLGRLTLKTVLFYLTTSLMAILIALTLVNIVKPGIINGEPAKTSVNLPKELDDSTKKKVQAKDLSTVADVGLSMIPTNILKTASDNRQILGLIFFSIIFAYFLGRLQDGPIKDTQMSFWEGLFEIMMNITNFVMKLAPYGVFALVAAAVGGMQLDQLDSFIWMLIKFTLMVVAALLIHALVVVPLILAFLVRVNPLWHFRAMAPALLTAFSTASSSATLPLTMECVEDKAKVSKRTTSFVLPLGATVNMDGTALYECAAAIFIAQAYGIDLSVSQQFLLVVIALLTSIGVAGIPAASLVAISIILGVFKVPLEGIMLLIVFDRILDMMRTSVNVLSDSVAAVVIAKMEGEKGLYQQHSS